jgi:hypothetical protein
MRFSPFSPLGAAHQVLSLTVYSFSSLFYLPVCKDIPLHATNAYVGVEVQLHLFSSWTLNAAEWSASLHQSLYPRGNIARCTMSRKRNGRQSQRGRKENKHLSHAGNRTLYSQQFIPQSSHSTDPLIPFHL